MDAIKISRTSLLPGIPVAVIVISFLSARDAVPQVQELYEFNTSLAHSAGLCAGRDGNLYGTTYGAGAHGVGGVYSVSPTGMLTYLYYFDGTYGRFSNSGLVQGPDGDFYGTLNVGGSNHFGAVFRVSSSGSFSFV